jgi:hypothetical protein
MNLVQLGTTASRANRGKSVKGSIAQSNGSNRYERNGVLVTWIPQDFICR